MRKRTLKREDVTQVIKLEIKLNEDVNIKYMEMKRMRLE